MGFLKTSVIVLIGAIVLNKLPGWLQGEDPLPPVKGYVAPGWEYVAQVYRQMFEEGDDRGSSFCVYHKGKPVIDLRGGYANEKEYWPWQENTVTRLFSTTKGISAIVVGVLVDRGLINYGDYVTKYWPEFGANGKEKVTVETLLSHSAGVAHITDESHTMWDEVEDMEKVGRLLAQQKPLWPPGSAIGYHAATIGMYMDQLVMRVDPQHRRLAQFFKEEIAVPFGLDIDYGLKTSEVYRSAVLDWFFPFKLRYFGFPDFQEFLYAYTIGKIGDTDTDYLSEVDKTWDIIGVRPMMIRVRPDVNAHPNPSTLARGNAQAVAKLYGILANGGTFEGKQLMSPATVEMQMDPTNSGKDKVTKLQNTYGRGYTIFKSPKNSTLFGTPGMGGQMGFADPKYKLGIGYTTNYLTMTGLKGHRYVILEEAIYKNLDNLQ